MTSAQRDTAIDLLQHVVEVLDNYSDVDDGDDGQPIANRAMSAMGDVEMVIALLEHETTAM